MGLGYGHPMGMLCSAHPLGLHVRLSFAETCSRPSARFASPPLLCEKVAAGELGRKTSRWFYTDS